MKKLLFVAAALALALPAAAQQKTRIGFGVSITPTDLFVNAATVQLYMPIEIGGNLRIEPSLGIFTVDAPTGGTDTSDVTIGAGVFGMKRVAQPVNMYYGGRLGLNFASFDTGAVDDSGVDLSIAGALGGEYYFTPSFSLGLEGQLGYYANSEATDDSSGFFTTGLAFLRMFF